MASEEPAEPPSKAPRAENSSPLPALAQGGGFGSLAAAAPASGGAFPDGGLGAVMQQPPKLFGEESKRTGECGVNSNAGDESASDGNADEASERPARHEREAEEEGKGCADTKGSCAAPQMSGQAERTGEVRCLRFFIWDQHVLEGRRHACVCRRTRTCFSKRRARCTSSSQLM